MSEWFSSRDGQGLINGTLPRIAKALEALSRVLETASERKEDRDQSALRKLRKEVERLQENELVTKRVWRARGTVYSTYDLAMASFKDGICQPEEMYVLYCKSNKDVLFQLKPIPVWFTEKDEDEDE